MLLNSKGEEVDNPGNCVDTCWRLGAELFDLSTANYRVRLHRARADLLNYIGGRCGLVDPKNSCRCYKKTGAMVQKGFVDREKHVFNAEYTPKVQ